jgi:hypothetical protein
MSVRSFTRRFDPLRIDLAVLAAHLQNLHAVREELGRTALVRFDVSDLVDRECCDTMLPWRRE